MVEVEILKSEIEKFRKPIKSQTELKKIPLFSRTVISNEAGRLDAQWLNVEEAGFLICLIKFNLGIGSIVRILAKRNLIFVPLLFTGLLNVINNNEKETIDIFPLQYYLFTMQAGEKLRITTKSTKGCMVILVLKKEYFFGMQAYYKTAGQLVRDTYTAKWKSFLSMELSLQQVMKFIFTLITGNTRLDYFKLSLSVQTIMAMVLTDIDKTGNEILEYGRYQDWQITNIEKVREYLKENFVEFAGMEALSKMAEMNLSTFRKIFYEITGNKVFEYWDNHRMELALKWLVNKEFKPLQVAINLGFASSQAFNKRFKKHYDVAPSRVYRRKM